MKTTSSFSLKPYWKQIIILAFVFIYIVINLARIGGDAFIIELNNLIVLPLALGAMVMTFVVLRTLKAKSQTFWLWFGMACSFTLWAVAEFWWGIASTVIGEELPTPSAADIFWLVGYIPMYIALGIRIHTMPKSINAAKQVGVGILCLAIVALSALFILNPLLQAGNPLANLGNLINFLYPVADLVLMIFVLQMFFSYQHGMYGRTWRWLSLGFFLFVLGDLVYAYAYTAGLYYPDGQVNLISTLGSDVPYNLSDLASMIGIYFMLKLHRRDQPTVPVKTDLNLVPNTHILVYTRGDDTVIDVSQNFAKVFPDGPVEGKTLAEVLGISKEDEASILREIKERNILHEGAYRARTRQGSVDISISGIDARNPQHEFYGTILLLRVWTADSSLNELLTDYQKEIAQSLLTKTGTEKIEQAELKQLLIVYYRAFISSFYNCALLEGGNIMADGYISELRTLVVKEGWPVEIQNNSLIDVSRLSLEEVRVILPALYETAKSYTAEITDRMTTNEIIADVCSKFSEAGLNNLAHFKLIETARD